MKTPESFGERTEPAEPSREDRVRRLIEAGDAVDEQDAEEALNEEEDAAAFREIEPAGDLAAIEPVLENPETPGHEVHDLCFRRAIVAVAQTPEERELLLYDMLRDLPQGAPRDEAHRVRQASTNARLERKLAVLVAQIGDERRQELFNLYRQTLQESLNRYYYGMR